MERIRHGALHDDFSIRSLELSGSLVEFLLSWQQLTAPARRTVFDEPQYGHLRIQEDFFRARPLSILCYSHVKRMIHCLRIGKASARYRQQPFFSLFASRHL